MPPRKGEKPRGGARATITHHLTNNKAFCVNWQSPPLGGAGGSGGGAKLVPDLIVNFTAGTIHLVFSPQIARESARATPPCVCAANPVCLLWDGACNLSIIGLNLWKTLLSGAPAPQHSPPPPLPPPSSQTGHSFQPPICTTLAQRALWY